MARVEDVARYITEQQGAMTAMKLQKLVYYSQAWHLVWDEVALFPNRIEAWANGPVCRNLYSVHHRQYMVEDATFGFGRPARLTESERGSIDAVVRFYGPKSGAELSELTHREAPWRDARGDTPPGVKSDAEITHVAMAEYYGGLVGTDDE